MVRVVEVENLVSEALLSEHVPVHLLVLLLVRTTFAIGLGLIARTFIDQFVAVLIQSISPIIKAIGKLKIIIVSWAHQWIVVAITSPLLSLLLLGLELVALLAPSDLGLTPQHLLLVLELKLRV